MTLTRVVQLGDRDVVVRELTVAELRQWIADERAERLGAAEDLIDQGLHDVPLSLVARFTRLPVDDLRALPPSQIDRVIDAGREVNPRFFGLLGRLQAAGSALPTSTGP